MRAGPAVSAASYPVGMSMAASRLWDTGYREWLPPAGLRASLTCLWVSVVASDGGQKVQVYPDGCIDLIWQSGYGAYLAGPDTGPAPAELPPDTIVVGARFRPGAGGPAIGLPLCDLRDQRIDLADCLPALARQLPADLPPAAALSVVTRLSAQLVAAGPPDPLVLEGTRLLARGDMSVASMSSELAVSERQLRRRFDAAVGYGPKMLHRVLRFRRVLADLPAAASQGDLAGLAIQSGFADQAHLTREMTSLAGLSPAALAKTLRPSQPVLVRY
jgi:AraC-like DNA-binding protein